MKSVCIPKCYVRGFLLVIVTVQVNGSLLSRLKNRYEYLPFSTKDFTAEQLDYTVEQLDLLSTGGSPTKFSHIYIPRYMHLYVPSSVTTNATFSYKSESAIREQLTDSVQYQKRTIGPSSEHVLYYYDQEIWPKIKLLVTLPTTRFQKTLSSIDPTKYRKKTWPSYFPPRFISKLQKELDDALLPWKPTTKILSSKSSNVSKLTQNVSIEYAHVKNHGAQASCYMCGLDQHGIPRMPGCHHYFESDDHRNRKIRRRFKVKCIGSDVKKQVNNKYYGPEYIGGCFKRFLDVGIEYNERGCRTKKPMKGKSYASRRLASLEKMLIDVDNGCVFSPYASLTPFSRAISLYARYHVCVCDTKYCNRASPTLSFNISDYILFILYFSIKS